MADFKNLISDDDIALLHEIKREFPIIRNKGASFVREVEKMIKLIDRLGVAKDATKNTDEVIKR